MSFAKIEMERWNKSRAKNGMLPPNSRRKHRNPKTRLDSSSFTSACGGSPIQIRLRKRSNEIRVSVHLNDIFDFIHFAFKQR